MAPRMPLQLVRSMLAKKRVGEQQEGKGKSKQKQLPVRRTCKKSTEAAAGRTRETKAKTTIRDFMTEAEWTRSAAQSPQFRSIIYTYT